MKKLKDIIENDNCIHASIHLNNNSIKEAYTVNDFLGDRKKEREESQPLHEELSKHYDLDKYFHEKHHLKEYSDDSSGVNNYLWKKHKKEKMDDEEKSFKEDVPHLDKALSTFRTHKDFTVHSGVIYNPIDKKNKEGVVHHPAYLSTSLERGRASAFSDLKKGNVRHVISIKIPKGSKGAYIGDHSYNQDEREFLIPRGANLKHIKTEVREENHPIYGKGDEKLEVHYHHMKWLNNEK